MPTIFHGGLRNGTRILQQKHCRNKQKRHAKRNGAKHTPMHAKDQPSPFFLRACVRGMRGMRQRAMATPRRPSWPPPAPPACRLAQQPFASVLSPCACVFGRRRRQALPCASSRLRVCSTRACTPEHPTNPMAHRARRPPRGGVHTMNRRPEDASRARLPLYIALRAIVTRIAGEVDGR